MKKERFFIVVVEDDEAIRGMLEEILKMDGFVVRAFPNGKIAKVYINTLDSFIPPHVVLTDINMPVMDGLELLKFLKKKYKKDKKPLLIAMSGLPENQEEAIEAGADFFLLKPMRGIGEKIKELIISR